MLQHLESEKSQWLFPEVEWCFYSLHTHRINGCYKSSCPEQRALLCPRGHGAATHGWQRHGRVAQCPGDWCATGHCSPGHSQCQHLAVLRASPTPKPSHRLLSEVWRAEPAPQSPMAQPSSLDALSRGWVEPLKPPEQGLNFICPCTAPSTPRVPLNTTNNHHALALNYSDATTLNSFLFPPNRPTWR